MQDIITAISEIRTDIPWKDIFLGIAILLLAQIVFQIFDSIIKFILKELDATQKFHNLRTFFVYFYNFILVVLFLKIVGLKLEVVLGATAFLTLAIAFAARVPISNLISGVFLIFEKPFVVGDIIEVNDFKGEVLSINLLSMTMRTLDNLMVRIPNELVISNAVRNVSFFPIRRLQIKYLMSNKESLTRLQEIFMQVAERNELALNEPEPYFYVTEFRENSIEVTFMVWSSSEDYFQFQSEFPKEIHRAVKNSGIDPIRSVVEVVNFDVSKDKLHP